RGTRHMIFLTMSTGVGAGFILDGRLYRGAHFLAGEVGHAPLRREGRRHAGLVGTLEAYAGGAALAERIREAIAAGGHARSLPRASARAPGWRRSARVTPTRARCSASSSRTWRRCWRRW